MGRLSETGQEYTHGRTRHTLSRTNNTIRHVVQIVISNVVGLVLGKHRVRLLHIPQIPHASEILPYLQLRRHRLPGLKRRYLWMSSRPRTRNTHFYQQPFTSPSLNEISQQTFQGIVH